MSADKNASLRLQLYRSMHRIRRVEEILIEEYHPANEMRCPIHFCVGQEASPAALGLTLTKDDAIFSHYRSHGYYLAKGAPLAAMVAEFYGKASGSNNGLAGSMELAHHGSKFHSGAIVGGTAGLAIGSAFAQKYRGARSITVAVFGDGAMDEGIGYEAINLAAIHDLPVLFLCENNGYAAHTSLASRSRSPSIAGRAAAFGIDTIQVIDGDPVALHETFKKLVTEMRLNGRPVFLEVDTYRFCSHVGPEDDTFMAYRPAEEVKRRVASDPLSRLRNAIEQSDERRALAGIDAAIEAEVADAIVLAKSAPFPRHTWAQSITMANTYDSVVDRLIEGPVAQFQGAQSEAKLAPY